MGTRRCSRRGDSCCACLVPLPPTHPLAWSLAEEGEAEMVAASGRATGFRRDWLIVWAVRGKETLMDAPLGQKGLWEGLAE